MLKGYKTFLVALAVAVFGALETFDFTAYLDAENASYVTLGLGVVMMILRGLTKTSMFKDE